VECCTIQQIRILSSGEYVDHHPMTLGRNHLGKRSHPCVADIVPRLLAVYDLHLDYLLKELQYAHASFTNLQQS
jgi:hypothetical protein